MIKLTLLLVIAATLGGCASLSYPLPKCDGYSRRPLNRSMWEWEGDTKLKQQQSEAKPPTPMTPFAEEAREPEAFARFDVERSYRRCEG